MNTINITVTITLLHYNLLKHTTVKICSRNKRSKKLIGIVEKRQQ